MYSRFLSRAAICGALVVQLTTASERVLRVCADPNNLPFSNQAEQGFENRIAEILARGLGAKLEYTWWPERKGFIKNSLDQNRCDLVVGVPTDLPAALTTTAYYRSTYVFVSRKDRNLQLTSLSDPRLTEWRIGVHVVGDGYAPPGQALARRGVANLIGFSLFGVFGEPDPPAKLVKAVANGAVDVAIIWGPFAGYFAKTQNVPLDIVAVSPEMFMAIPFTYSISAAVRKGELQFKAEVDGVLNQNCDVIQEVLTKYGVPQMRGEEPRCATVLHSASALLR